MNIESHVIQDLYAKIVLTKLLNDFQKVKY